MDTICGLIQWLCNSQKVSFAIDNDVLNVSFLGLLFATLLVWGSGIQELTKTSEYLCSPGRTSLFSSIYQNFGIPDVGSYFSSAKELLDTMYFFWIKTGGLYDFASPSMTCLYRRKHTFSVSQTKSNKGVEATLWDVPQWRNQDTESKNQENQKRLLVFNTHLDAYHHAVANRRAQIGEILDFMEDTMQSIEKVEASTMKGREDDSISVLSADNRESSRFNWSHTAVLVVGDFNIKAGSKEYWETLEFVESRLASTTSNGDNAWKDFFASVDDTDINDEDQHTYALQNSLALDQNAYGRIDYIFGIQRFGKPPKAIESTPQKEAESSRTFMPLNVVSRLIRQEPIGEESSDHYALVLEVIPAI